MAVTPQVVILTSGSSWTRPANCPSILASVECWGAGAGGNPTNVNIGAGGGGAYARSLNFSIGAVRDVPYSVSSTGGTQGNNGSNTWFLSATSILAVGGKASTGSNVGAGGSSAACICNDIKYSGGSGHYSSISESSGGPGGGGSASKYGNGGNSTATTSGNLSASSGGSSPSAGAGGSGGDPGNDGTSNVEGGGGGGGGNGGTQAIPFSYIDGKNAGNGGSPGGGGGRGGNDGSDAFFNPEPNNLGGTGGIGGGGQIRITYYPDSGSFSTQLLTLCN